MTTVTEKIDVDSVAGKWWNDYAELLREADAVRVVIYFRSLAPSTGTHSPRRRVLETITDATQTSLLDEFAVETLGKELCLCRDCRRQTQVRERLETVESLDSWRDDSATSVGFTRRNVDSWFTGENRETITPPETTLAVYADDSLAVVFPCEVEGRYLGVHDFLDLLFHTGANRQESQVVGGR